MLDQLENIRSFIGNTPLKTLRFEGINLYTKLEYSNLTGSIKDRPAYRILLEALIAGKINKDTTIIESSSGNFAIALSTMCRNLGIKFIAVIDPLINKEYENLLQVLCYRVIKVTKTDETGGYLLSRIKTVQHFCKCEKNAFWPNQYDNVYNYLSYYDGLGNEISNSFSKLDYAFIGVSSGGTITGLSLKLKESFPEIKIVGVDIEGSVIFGGKAQKRYIPGIGASKCSSILRNAKIDEVVIVQQLDVIAGCKALLQDQVIFGGGSSGAVYQAIKQYFEHKILPNRPNVLFMCPDKGTAYLDTIYRSEWKKWLEDKLEENMQSITL